MSCALGDLVFAVGFKERLLGVLGCEPELELCSLVFKNCRSLHTFGLTESIAVVETDPHWIVVAVWLVPPGRIFQGSTGSVHLIESDQKRIPELIGLQGSSQKNKDASHAHTGNSGSSLVWPTSCHINRRA